MSDFVHSISFQVFLGTVPIASLLYLLNLSANKRVDSLESSLNKRVDDLMEYMRQSFSAVNSRINELSDRIKRIEDKVFK